MYLHNVYIGIHKKTRKFLSTSRDWVLVDLRWLSEVRSRNARRLHRIETFDVRSTKRQVFHFNSRKYFFISLS